MLRLVSSCPVAVSRLLLPGFYALLLAGCAGGSGRSAQNPVSVYLPIPKIELTEGAGAIIIPIQIASPSETAQVAVSNLPAGVQVRYASTDTNPSGTLSFMANESAMAGTFMPIVTVNSAGLTASTGFTLVVKAP